MISTDVRRQDRRPLVILLLLCVIALSALACQPAIPGDEDGPGFGPPVAAFTQSRTSVLAGQTVQFTNLSTGAFQSTLWDFGGAGASTDNDPLITFSALGAYDVELTVSGPEGASNILERQLIDVVTPAVAGFSCTPDSGDAPLTITCTDSSTNATRWLWDFGDGQTSTERNPQHEYTSAGSPFTVTLTASGPANSDTATQEITVSVQPVIASFSCVMAGDTEPFVDIQGFAPVEISCTNTSTNASSFSWDFGDGSAVVTSESPTHTYTGDVDGLITLTATGPGGTDTATQSVLTHLPVITADVVSGTGSPPLTVEFTVSTGAVPFRDVTWDVDNDFSQAPDLDPRSFSYPFDRTGSYTVRAQLGQPISGDGIPASAAGLATLGYDVADSAIGGVDFYPCEVGETCPGGASEAPIGGAGDVSVQFFQSSTGGVTSWTWDFGDGTSCIQFADPANPSSTCGAIDPTHTYSVPTNTPIVDRIFDVSLTVAGSDGSGGTTSTTVPKTDQVRVFMFDPSFEDQTAGADFSGAWTSIFELTGSPHGALNGSDQDFPTDGSLWGLISGLGTDGNSDVASVANGVTQDFIYTTSRPVLGFDFALLYNEPPDGAFADAFTATVSDGSTTVEVPNARFDVSTPIAGESAKLPGGSPPVAVTIQGSASIDLSAQGFSRSPDEAHTLTFRVSNGGGNANRTPLAYIDNIRFSRKAEADFTTSFTAPGAIAAGRAASFENTTCGVSSDQDPLCSNDTTWRWDFGTHGTLASPGRTGSSALSPSYTFPSPGTFTVALEGHRAQLNAATDDIDMDRTATMNVTVIEAPVADFTITPVDGLPITVGEALTIEDTSTSDASDGIAQRIWDFAGFVPTGDGNPFYTLTICTPGTYTIELFIETDAGFDDTRSQQITVESVAPVPPACL